MALKKFVASTGVGSTVQQRRQWAIDQANTFRVNNPTSPDLYDPVANNEVFTNNRGIKIGAQAKQCIAVFDESGNSTSPLNMKSYVRIEVPAGTITGAQQDDTMFN